jgi:hypothetical protein
VCAHASILKPETDFHEARLGENRMLFQKLKTV